MKSAHAMLLLLEKQRQQTHDIIGDRPIGAAACQVLDELIGRIRVITDQAPADAKITLADIQRFSDITAMLDTVAKVSVLMREGAEAVDQRRQPFLRFVARLESGSYDVSENLAVTDTTDWASLENNTSDPAAQVQLAADKIARAEQAAIYQTRLQRMVAEIADTENRYAQQIRDLSAESD